MKWLVWLNLPIVKDRDMNWIQQPGWHWCWWDGKLICMEATHA